MKNKTVNKKVLRAMSIGLAAMMTVQPVLAAPVFADETEPSEGTESTVETTTESSSSEASTESTSAPAPTVENVTQSYTEASNATGDIRTSLDQAVSAGRDSSEYADFDKDNGGALTALNNAVTGTEIGAVDKTTLDNNRTDVSNAAIQLVNDAKRDDKIFEVDADELLKGQVNKDINNIETADKNLNDAIDAQDKALDELNNKIEITNSFTGTDGLINLETGKIESATSIPAATESLENATEFKDEADKKFDQSKADYDNATAEYEKAKADLEAKQKVYNDALNAAVADDSALAKAKAELETAKSDCDNLEKQITEAQDALSKSAIGKLASALAKTKENANDWSSLDLIMKDVIKYYYFPSIGVNSADVKIDNQFTKNSALADGTKNERANYIKATVNGKVYYLNYICEKDGTPDDKISNDGRYPKMVIFEKNPEVIGNHYEVEGTDTKYSSADVENTEKKVTLEFIKNNATTDFSGKFIINDGTTYHIDSEGAVTEVTVGDMSNVTSTGAGKSGSYISKVEEGETFTELKDGVLTVKTEGSVTTTTFEAGKSLDDIESSESESSYDDAVKAAEAARDAAVKGALEDGHTLQKDDNGNDIVSSDITVSAEASAEATVEYKTKFTTTINFDKKLSVLYDRSEEISKDTNKEAKEVKKVLEDLINEIKSSLEKDYSDVSVSGNYGIVHNSEYDGVWGLISEAFTLNHYVGTGSVTFTYYSKSTATAKGESSYKGEVENDFSTDNILQSAKENAVSNAIADSKPTDDSIKKMIDGQKRHGSSYELWFFGTQYNDAKFKLADKAVSTSSEVVDVKGSELNAADAKATASVEYNYKVSNIKYADQYDTVEEGQTIYSKKLNLSALTSVDDYAAIPLLNDNYYNYKNGNSSVGIFADLGDTDSDIYKSLMKDVENANKLAAKYEDARKDAEAANKMVQEAQKKVNALIDSINALKNASGSEYEKKLAALEAKLAEAQKKLEEATGEKKLVDEAYERALAAYEDAVARLTPALATGDEETSPAGGGTTTPAPATTLATTLAGAPAFTLPLAADTAPAAGVAGARTIRSTAADSDSESTATDTTAKIAPEKEVEEDALAITKDTIKTIKDNETPLSSLTEDSTQKMNWWWLLLIALLGATGEEIYRRNKKKKEEEAALKAEVDKK